MTPVRQIVALLILLQIVSVLSLWSLNALGTLSEGRFAVLLATDLLSFAIVAYVYTHEKWGEVINRGWILAGSLGLVVLLISSLYLS